MAGINSPASSSTLPTPSTSTSSRKSTTTTPAAPKLRDSCHACANSKLKCYKEKPTCSRCAKRGITCEYVATKRAGRRHTNNKTTTNESSRNTSPTTTTNNENNQLVTPLSGWFDSKTTAAPNAEPLPSPGATNTSPSAASSLFSNMFSPADQSSALLDMTADLDDFFGSPMDFSMPDMSGADFMNQASFFPAGGMDGSSNGSDVLFDTFPGFEDAVSDLLAFSNPPSPPPSRASPSCDIRSYQASHVNETSCYCLVRALGLMKQLSTNASGDGAMSDITQNGSFVPTIQSVIAQNESTIEAVSTMLQCSCSHDGYLLTIMSLIVFKVLGWYATAARNSPFPSNHDNENINTQSPSSCHNSRHPSLSEQVQLQNPAVINNYCLSGEDSSRMAAQLVLSELHRVQRLVNQLSLKLKMHSQQQKIGGSDAPDSRVGFAEMADVGYETGGTLPLSGVMLNQLELDLRRRLRALSLEIVDRLRKE